MSNDDLWMFHLIGLLSPYVSPIILMTTDSTVNRYTVLRRIYFWLDVAGVMVIAIPVVFITIALPLLFVFLPILVWPDHILGFISLSIPGAICVAIYFLCRKFEFNPSEYVLDMLFEVQEKFPNCFARLAAVTALGGYVVFLA